MSSPTTKSAPAISLGESIIYNLAHVLPFFLRGIFTRNHFWYMVWSRYHPDPLGLRFIAALRQKYQSDYLYLYMLNTKSLLVLDRAGIQHVLDNSPAIYADAKLKRKGMSHFQPHSLTISCGEEWKERRKFNETVLNSGHSTHPHAEAFLAIVRQEVNAPGFAKADLRWGDFAELFERITLQIVFGKGELGNEGEGTPMTEALTRMMGESNRIVGLRPSRYFDGFYQRIRHSLAHPKENSLAHLASVTPATAQTRVENQLTHWLFAMKDTLAENVVPALALICAHPEAEARVRQEMANADLTTAQGIASLSYLEACVQEAMRLWPTTPMLTRESVVADSLEGIPVASGTQVVILSSFSHRDIQTNDVQMNGDANAFCPELWLAEQGDESISRISHHFSNGPQICAGKELALFIAKSVLATMLSAAHYRLQRPTLAANEAMPQTFNPFLARFGRRTQG